jgi:CDP-diacylglycerol--glycerol-3-phosphate 3-phosphatidyltransferase
MMSVDRLQVFRKAIAAYITRPAVFLLAKTSLTPNAVTLIGFAIILAAAALVGTGHPFAAGWVVLLSGFFDIIDGALARQTNRVTKFGGILDSTLDRISEAAILLGLMAFYLYYNSTTPAGGWIIVLLGLTLIGSFMVSYIRSRSEAAGLDCQVGIFTRAERVIILSLGLILSSIDYVLVVVLGLISFFSLVTVVQRLLFVYQQTKK